jgi:hypothetical protein
MLTVVQDADEANGNEAGRRSLLDEIDRDGARQMLAAAWQAAVAAYVELFADQRDDNGPPPGAAQRISAAPRGSDCGRCGRGHRAAGQRRVDPETGERQRFP